MCSFSIVLHDLPMKIKRERMSETEMKRMKPVERNEKQENGERKWKKMLKRLLLGSVTVQWSES